MNKRTCKSSKTLDMQKYYTSKYLKVRLKQAH